MNITICKEVPYMKVKQCWYMYMCQNWDETFTCAVVCVIHTSLHLVFPNIVQIK